MRHSPLEKTFLYPLDKHKARTYIKGKEDEMNTTEQQLITKIHEDLTGLADSLYEINRKSLGNSDVRAAFKHADLAANAIAKIAHPDLRIILTNHTGKVIMDCPASYSRDHFGYWLDDPPKHLFDLIDALRPDLDGGLTEGTVSRKNSKFHWHTS